MTYRIEGWCIIDTTTLERWGSLYESEAGAKRSYNDSIRYMNKKFPKEYPLFNDQSKFILQPLVLIDSEESKVQSVVINYPPDDCSTCPRTNGRHMWGINHCRHCDQPWPEEYRSKK